VAVVEKHYEGIAAHVDFLARQAGYGDGVPQFGMLGDWCSVERFCPGSSDDCLANPGWTSGDATVSDDAFSIWSRLLKKSTAF